MRVWPTARLVIGVAFALALVTSCSSTATKTSTSTTKDTFCGLLVAFRAANDSLDANVASGDPVATKDALTRLVAQAKTLKKRAPDDIADYVATVSGFIDDLDALFADYGYDLNRLSTDPDATERYAALSSTDVQTALDQLRAYGDIDCGDKTPPADTTVSTTSTLPAASTTAETTTLTTTTIAATTTVP